MAEKLNLNSQAKVGVVVIGRNEGDRLPRCLSSKELQVEARVYVDSGSADNSIAVAREHGYPTIELDAAVPFTAARARNTGFEWLLSRYPEMQFVQFVDADSVLQCGWLATGVEFLNKHERTGVVCGNLRERDPAASVYNRLCDIEWQVPAGEISSSGGIAMFRCSALCEARGFREDLIAGEEPDLCFRLRRKGWSISKIDVDMAIHDAAMERVAQWWARSKRSGYAAAQALALRGRQDKALLRPVVSNTLWSLPIAWPLWPLLWVRVFTRRGGEYATHIVLGKIPHFVGQVSYWRTRLSGRKPELIEHK